MPLNSKRYRPPCETTWIGRDDGTRIYQVVETADINYLPDLSKSFCILGFASDEGVRRNNGRVGARQGPIALRKALAPKPLHKPAKLFDLGDIVCGDGNLEEAQEALQIAVSKIIQAGGTPIIIGGGHEVAFGHYLGLQDALSNKLIGIVNFDAHFDLRKSQNGEATSGTPFRQIAEYLETVKQPFNYTCIGIQESGNTDTLFQEAKERNVQVVLAKELVKEPLPPLNLPVQFYLTLCLDLFAAPFAPGVSAPQPLGLTPWQILPLFEHIIKEQDPISFEIAELAPIYDHDNRTANLAATLVSTFIHNKKIH